MASFHRRIAIVLLALACAFCGQAGAQGANSTSSTPLASWTVNANGNILWQQVTPAGALLICTGGALAGIDTDAGRVVWQKPELAGISADSVQPVEGSLLMEASRPQLLVIFDPVTGAVVFDSRSLELTKVITRRVLPESGTLLVHGQRAIGDPVVALYDLASGQKLWANETLFTQPEQKKRGFGALMQNLTRMAGESTQLEVLQAGDDDIVVYTYLGLRALDARTGELRWSAPLPTRTPAHFVRLYPSLAKPDRFYASFDDSLMAFRLADGQALWAKAARVDGRIRDIVQHPAGIVMLPEAPPENQATGSRRVINGIVQTGINVARYDDGATIAPKPVRMHGDVIDAMIAGDSVVLAVDAESKTYVNVLDVATASLRLKKDAGIKGQLAYAELMPAGLLYVSRPDTTINAEANIIDLSTGQVRFKGAIESGRPLSADENSYNAARYYLHTAVEGNTLYVFANRDHRLYAIDRQTGNYQALGGDIKLQGGEDPLAMEIRPEGIVLSSQQNLVIVGRDGQIRKQVYYPAPQAPGLLRALYAVTAVRAALYSAAASAYGDAFAQASRQSDDPAMRHATRQLAVAYTRAGRRLDRYARQSAALATKRFKASLDAPGFVFMLTKAPDGHGNVLLQIDKDTAQPRATVNLGKEMEPSYSVDDIAGMLFLQTAPGTLVGYRL